MPRLFCHGVNTGAVSVTRLVVSLSNFLSSGIRY